MARDAANLMSFFIFQPMGTYGYAAPEYIETGHLKSNSDLWSFGVVVYEILMGRRAVDTELPQSEQKLIEWVKQFPVDSKRFRMIMDPRLNNQYSHGAARKVAKLADSCLRKNPVERPLMSKIVDILRQTIRESELNEFQKSRDRYRYLSLLHEEWLVLLSYRLRDRVC
ncbi:putative protein kinase RLK-Pelle-RLCK-VIIa-2 family [Helianthus annuus]|nr:putative protein kinase RLK-Pelle-RLCK-VIIa-2 family [Helianthus annuus]